MYFIVPTHFTTCTRDHICFQYTCGACRLSDTLPRAGEIDHRPWLKNISFLIYIAKWLISYVRESAIPLENETTGTFGDKPFEPTQYALKILTFLHSTFAEDSNFPIYPKRQSSLFAAASLLDLLVRSSSFNCQYITLFAWGNSYCKAYFAS